jgi:tetratricopeptide (TPR) repeat protein
VEGDPGQAAPPCFGWNIVAHAKAEDLALVDVSFRVLSLRDGCAFRWRFDDGTEAAGAEVRHVFLAPGLRKVELEADAASGQRQRNSRIVSVHPQWSQIEEWPAAVFARQKADILGRDLRAAPAADLLQLWKIAALVEDAELLTHAGAAALARQKEFGGEQAYAFTELALHFQGPRVRDYGRAEEAFRAAIALAPRPAVAERTKVFLAWLLVHALGEPAKGLELIRSVQTTGFAEETRRRRILVEGDALADLGDLESARATYLSADVEKHSGSRATVRRRAHLEAARGYLRRKDYDEADRLLREIEWEAPLERLDTETGLLMLRVNGARGEHALALTRCRRLLRATPDEESRSELLLVLAETQSAMGQTEAARESFQKLISECRYSEAAARARDRWGDAGPAATPAPQGGPP